MADLAQIGFASDTSGLVQAEKALDRLPPAAGRAERSAAKLSAILDRVDAAAGALAAAAAGLSAAADKMTKAVSGAAAASTRKGKAANDAAKATKAEAAAAEAAAAAARKEAAAVDAAAKAHDRNTAAKRRSASVPSVGGGTLGRPSSGPWGTVGAANDSARGGGRGAVDGMLAAQSSPSNIAAQFQDIGVTAAMGMNPLLIALQQGTQLSMAFAGGLGQVMAALKMVFGLTAILTIATVALGAALLQMVNWTKLAQGALNLLADTLPYVAAGLTIVGARLLWAFGPAILAAITSISISIAAGLVTAIGALVAAVGAIPLAIGLIIADLIIFRDAWKNVLGFDLVQIAKDGIDWVIGAFVGAYNSVKAAWGMLPAAMEDIFSSVVNAVMNSVERMVNGSIEGINALIDYLPDWLKPEGAGGAISWRLDLNDWKRDVSGAASDMARVIQGEMDNAMQGGYVDAAVNAVTGTLSSISDKIRNFASGLGAEDKKKKKGGGKTDAEKFDDIINGVERSIASLEAERAAIGMNELAAAKLRKETELLNEAKQKGLTLSPQQRDQLIALAHGMAELEYQTNKAKEALDFTKDTFKGFLTDLRDGLAQGKSFWESFGQAALNVLNKIADKLLNEVVDALFEVNKAASSGGGRGGILGFLGGLFGLGGGGGSSFPLAPGAGLWAKGGAFPGGISGHSNSVVNTPTLFAFASGAGIMGEAGPEAIMPLRRGPDGSLGVQMYGGKSGDGGRGDMNVTYAPSYTVEAGATQEAVAELRKIQDEDRRNFTSNVENAIGDLRMRSSDV